MQHRCQSLLPQRVDVGLIQATLRGMLFRNSRNRLTENTTLTLGSADPVVIELRASKRARRLSLRVSRLDGRVTLTAPHGANTDEAITFATERLDWIRGHLAQTAPNAVPAIGSTLPFRGQSVTLVRGQARVVEVAGDRMLLPPQSPDRDAIRAEMFLKEAARAALVAASDTYAAQVGARLWGGASPYAIRGRAGGSCSSRGNLSYSWRLIMAPPEVLDYVAAHEVAHLVHMDHSRAFWAQVEAVCPNYKAPRKWLREYGAELHRYRFRD